MLLLRLFRRFLPPWVRVLVTLVGGARGLAAYRNRRIDAYEAKHPELLE